MSKRRKSRRTEPPEVTRLRELRENDRRSMNHGLAKVSAGLEINSHDPNDELPLGFLSAVRTAHLQPSWWSQVISPSLSSMWVTPLVSGLGMVGGSSIDKAKLELLKVAEPRKIEQRMPDYVQVITAWRAWRVIYSGSQWQLKALGAEFTWKPRESVQATCNAGFSSAIPSHPAPARDCNCGVWAFKELDSLVAAIGSAYGEIKVLGQVSLWGRVIETENGYRAEKAYPSELWLLDSSLEELGLIYDVPVRTINQR